MRLVTESQELSQSRKLMFAKKSISNAKTFRNPMNKVHPRYEKPTHFFKAKLRINKNRAVLFLAEKLKTIMMDNVKTFFIRATFVASIHAINHKPSTTTV